MTMRVWIDGSPFTEQECTIYNVGEGAARVAAAGFVESRCQIKDSLPGECGRDVWVQIGSRPAEKFNVTVEVVHRWRAEPVELSK